MNRSDAKLFVGCVLAVVVPTAILHFTAADGRRDAGMTAAPFAWPRLLVAHLVTALLLGVIVARWLRSHSAVNEVVSGVWVVIGLGAAGFAALVGPGVGESIASSEIGTVVPLLMRTLLAVVLVLPWCVAALDTPTARKAIGHPGIVFGIGLALATIPCAAYADAMVAARTEQVRELLARERLVKADPVLTGLCELGSTRPIGKQSPSEIRKALAAHLPKLRKLAERSLPPSAPPQARIGRAALLIQLDRLDDAAHLLRPLAADDVTATMLLATVFRDQERWAESDALFSAALEKLLPQTATNPAARAGCLTAFEGLAFNARADRRPADAERVLKRGLEALPAEAAFFDFQLGKHYHDGGRPHLAVEHLRAAADRDPAKYRDPADKLIRTIRTTTPACLPRTPS